MRSAFMRALIDSAKDDPAIYLVVGDLGFSVVEPFVEKFPDRFVNVGVAEQNMSGIAAGLALCGKIVFTYSIANFPSLRCLEQIRNDICYHRANVKVVSVGGGLGYASLGITHHATEDLAIFRALPNMVVVAPGDPIEASEATRAVIEQPGPCYLRLGKSGEPVVHTDRVEFRLGKAIRVRNGRDLCIIATGGILVNCVKAADQLSRLGLETRVLSMHTIKPLDIDAILQAAYETAALVTVEEHSVIGGLGSAVAEILAESDLPRVPFRRIGLPAEFTPQVGSQEYLRDYYSLSISRLVTALESVVEHAKSAH
jgi:transketolase